MRKNWHAYERDTMKRFGQRPTPGSGNTPFAPEDGESEHFLMQQKSTEKQSISLKLQDLLDLSYHASVAHKIPVFVLDIQGVQVLCVRPEHLNALRHVYDERAHRSSEGEEE